MAGLNERPDESPREPSEAEVLEPGEGGDVSELDIAHSSSGIVFEDHLSAAAKNEERGAFSIDRSEPGFSQVADHTENGTRQATLGKSTQGEEGAFQVGQLLAKAWSTHDSVWEAGKPRSGRTGPHERFGEEVDVLLRCIEGERADEGVQVTRIGPEEYRRALGQNGAAEGEYSSEQVVGLMLDRVQAKGSRLDPRDLILALDATQFSAAVLGGVIEAARARVEEFRAVGFREVWVVGWGRELVYRLDA